MEDFISVETNVDSFQGNSALRLRNPSDQYLWIRSNAFAVPETGRLSISVWLKLGKDQQKSPLRISVESDDRTHSYYRFAEVGTDSEERADNQLSDDWKQFAVHFDDLPERPISGLRVGFDLVGPGEVWVDNIQVFDRWLDENDAKAVTQMLASIGPLLHETETLERCRMILNGYWPTFLRRYFDEGSDTGSVAEAQSQPVRSTMRQRFRRFVSPGIFQFR